jgi:hypothetical protein
MKKFLVLLVVALALAAAFAIPALAANGGATPGNTPGGRAGCCPAGITVCPVLNQAATGATATTIAVPVDTDLPPCCQTGVVPATGTTPATVCPVLSGAATSIANMPCATVSGGTVTLPCAPAGGGCPMFR